MCKLGSDYAFYLDTGKEMNNDNKLITDYCTEICENISICIKLITLPEIAEADRGVVFDWCFDGTVYVHDTILYEEDYICLYFSGNMVGIDKKVLPYLTSLNIW